MSGRVESTAASLGETGESFKEQLARVRPGSMIHHLTRTGAALMELRHRLQWRARPRYRKVAVVV